MIVDPSITYTREQVVTNIRKAASAGPVSFDFLLKQAEIESGLNPNAKASTSTAAGPFQFVNGTWLRMVEKHGDSVGLAEQAAALRENRLDTSAKAELLALRSDVTLSAKMAARLAVDNAQALAASGQKNIGPAELYLAHFLGAAGAADFLAGMRANPNAPAADAVPAAARSNTNVFYANGAPRTFTEIYDRFAQKFMGVSAPMADSALSQPGAQQMQPLAGQSFDSVRGGRMANALKMGDPANSNLAEPNAGLPADPSAGANPASQDAVAFEAAAKEALADARAALKTAQRQGVERVQDAKNAAETVAADVAQITEEALSQYLAGFSKNYQDPAKTPLEGAQTGTRDASRGASEDAREAAAPAVNAMPQIIGAGMKGLVDTAGGKASKTAARADEPVRSAPAMAPSVRQAVQWVSLFSDPRGADPAPNGRG